MLHHLLLLLTFLCAASGQKIVFPTIRCYSAYLRVGFELEDFDNYDKYFRDDSVMELAQAGQYVGANDIQEYALFGSSASPFFSKGPIQHSLSFRFGGYNQESGQCQFLAVYVHEFTTNPEHTLLEANYRRTIMAKLFIDPHKLYVSRVNLYYAPGFLSLFFGQFLVSDATRRFICSVINDDCAGILDPEPDCTDDLAALPAVANETYVDSSSQSCRSLHAVFARTNHLNHCPHISLTPMEDPKGRTKCTTSDGNLPSELFTAEDFAFHDEVLIDEGFDPAVGHDYQ